MTRGRTVLIVEDDPMSLELMTDLLDAAGWTVLVATSGEAAMQALEHHPVDLVLLDIGLPGMDGHAAMRAIRGLARGAGLPIVAVTAQAMAGDAERALRAGFDGYLTKPVDTRRVVATIDAILAARDPTHGSRGGPAP